MAAVIRRVGPLRLRRNRNTFIVLCKSIIAQQISTSAAETITRRFHGLFESRRPTPARLLALPEASLRSAGLSRQKTEYLRDLSGKFLGGDIRPHRLRFLADEEVIDGLTRVRGIGRWTAEMFLIFSLNRPDVLPVDDLGFRAAVKNIYAMKSHPSTATVRALGEKWRPLRTVAVWYAWRSLDARIVAY